MQITQDILEKINHYDTIILHRHMNPDPDAIGSQVGLKEIIQTNFPDKRVLATGYNEPTLAWMASMDTVTDEDYAGALVIVCDTANTPRIDDKRYTSGDFLIKIDHHPNDDAYGDLLWVDTDSSSTSELITLFALEQELEISPEAAVSSMLVLSETLDASSTLRRLAGLSRWLPTFVVLTLTLQVFLVRWTA